MVHPSLRCTCGHSMRLPYLSFPEIKPSQSAWSPKEFLAREVACVECGRAALYATKDVHWDQVAADQIAGLGAICWCIETGCNEPLCELPIEFHLLTDAQKGMEEIRFLMRRLFERGFFQKLICGRGHPPGKSRIRAVRRVG
jgi:hypothetical protein